MEQSGGYRRIFEGTLARSDSRSYRRFEFSVPVGIRAVEVRFEYVPRREEPGGALGAEEFRRRWGREIERYRAKVRRTSDPALLADYERFVDDAVPRVQPLSNLLNLAVFDSAGTFRGRWDSPQHFAEWVSIGESEATRGFVSGSLPAGQWSVILECHAVVTEGCAYELEIRCMASEGAWYRGELHAHTDHSDGALTPHGLVSAAAEAGLDFLVVTDHNTVSALGALGLPSDIRERAAAQARSPGPLVIPGMEFTTFFGHAVAIGVSEFIPWHGTTKKEGLNWQAEEVRRRGGLFSIAHPFSVGYPVCAGCEWEYDSTDLSLVDLVEVWSGPWRPHILWNLLALKWWDEMLCRGHRVGGVAARDVHGPGEFAREETADTYVWARSLDERDILQGLRTGRMFVSSGPLLEFSMRAGESDIAHLPGDRVGVRPGESLAFTAKLHQRGGPGEKAVGDTAIRVVRGARDSDAGVAVELPLTDGGCVEFEDTARRDGWYRCEVVGRKAAGMPGPHFLALSNPIYIEVTHREDA